MLKTGDLVSINFEGFVKEIFKKADGTSKVIIEFSQDETAIMNESSLTLAPKPKDLK